MRTELRPALVVLVLITLVTGVVYPLAVTAIGRVVFPAQASGSLIMAQGRAVGSKWIGQSFDTPHYFWGRLSATGPFAYNAASSSGSNLGPMNPTLRDAAQARIAALRAADSTARDAVPIDLVTASGSGLDPHISPAAAEYQVARVARARGMTPEALSDLVQRYTTGRTWGVLGEPVVNVLELNLALDGAATSSTPR